jgi:hypothetical protein
VPQRRPGWTHPGVYGVRTSGDLLPLNDATPDRRFLRDGSLGGLHAPLDSPHDRTRRTIARSYSRALRQRLPPWDILYKQIKYIFNIKINKKSELFYFLYRPSQRLDSLRATDLFADPPSRILTSALGGG